MKTSSTKLLILNGINILLILFSIIYLTGCSTMPPLPPGQLYILDSKINKTSVYDTPKSDGDKFIYKETIPFMDAFTRTPTKSMFCITPEYYIDLKNYAKDVEKYIERKCSK